MQVDKNVAVIDIGPHINVLSGFAFSSDAFHEVEGVPLIRIRDLGKNDTEVRFRGRYDDQFVVRNGDTLIGMDGDFVAVRWGGGAALLNQRVCKVSARPGGALDDRYLFHVLQPELDEIHRRTPQTTVRHLSTTTIRDIRPFVPPLPEQRRIAEILDTLDEAIRKTEQVTAKLQQMKQGLLHDLLTRGIDENGELRDPDRHPEQFKDSPLGRIPRVWEVTQLGRLCHRTTYGFTNPMPTVDQGPWMLTAADIEYGSVRYDTARRTTHRAFGLLTAKSKPRPGDILVTKDGTLGRVALLDSEDVCVNQSVAVLQPREAMLARFLVDYLLSPPGQAAMLADVGGSTIKHIYITQLALMQVPAPPRAEADRITCVIGGTTKRLRQETSELVKLRTLKRGLMDDLLTGRVRVSIPKEKAA